MIGNRIGIANFDVLTWIAVILGSVWTAGMIYFGLCKKAYISEAETVNDMVDDLLAYPNALALCSLIAIIVNINFISGLWIACGFAVLILAVNLIKMKSAKSE